MSFFSYSSHHLCKKSHFFLFLRAINIACENLGKPDQNLSDAVEVRRELDLRIGNSVLSAIFHSIEAIIFHTNSEKV